jgi:hypothetical protein
MYSKKLLQKEKNMIKIQSTKEIIESKGGLILAAKVAVKSGLGKIKSSFVKQAASVIISLYGIMLEGKNDFESTGEKRSSLFFKEAFGLEYVYAKETVRLYIEKMAHDADEIIMQLRNSSAKIISKAPLHGIWINGLKYLPVDIDTMAMDNSKTKKEGVSRTYRGFDGYHPILAYVGKEGYIIDCELRPGRQHCQKGTVAFIEGVKEQLKIIKASGRILFGMDSGNDSFDTLKAVSGKGHYCIIKRNKRRESDEMWLERAKKYGKQVKSRKGKKVWIGSLEMHPVKKDEVLKGLRCVFQIIERKIDAKGNLLLFPQIKVNTWWTNLNFDAKKVIKLYHDHATSEQFHSELKDDMDIERLPSGKFAVNKIVFAIAMNAYNTLRILGQKSIENKRKRYVKRKRLFKVIRDLICVAGKLVKHGRELIFKINEKDPVLQVLLSLNNALDSS